MLPLPARHQKAVYWLSGRQDRSRMPVCGLVSCSCISVFCQSHRCAAADEQCRLPHPAYLPSLCMAKRILYDLKGS